MKIHKEGNELYPMRCLIFKPPDPEHTQYVSITMKKDVPFLTIVDFHEHQRSSCPTTISKDLQQQVYLTPRKEFFIRYVIHNFYITNNVLTFLSNPTSTLNFSTFRDTQLEMKSEIFVNTYDKACNEDQTTMINNCINDFIHQKINCSLPWTNHTGKGFHYLIGFF